MLLLREGRLSWVIWLIAACIISSVDAVASDEFYYDLPLISDAAQAAAFVLTVFAICRPSLDHNRAIVILSLVIIVSIMPRGISNLLFSIAHAQEHAGESLIVLGHRRGVPNYLTMISLLPGYVVGFHFIQTAMRSSLMLSRRDVLTGDAFLFSIYFCTTLALEGIAQVSPFYSANSTIYQTAMWALGWAIAGVVCRKMIDLNARDVIRIAFVTLLIGIAANFIEYLVASDFEENFDIAPSYGAALGSVAFILIVFTGLRPFYRDVLQTSSPKTAGSTHALPKKNKKSVIGDLAAITQIAFSKYLVLISATSKILRHRRRFGKFISADRDQMANAFAYLVESIVFSILVSQTAFDADDRAYDFGPIGNEIYPLLVAAFVMANGLLLHLWLEALEKRRLSLRGTLTILFYWNGFFVMVFCLMISALNPQIFDLSLRFSVITSVLMGLDIVIFAVIAVHYFSLFFWFRQVHGISVSRLLFANAVTFLITVGVADLFWDLQ